MDDDYDQDFEEDIVEEDIPESRDDSPPKGNQKSKRYQNDYEDDPEIKQGNKSQMRTNPSGKNTSSISSAKVRKTIQAKPINHTAGGNGKKKKEDTDSDGSPLPKPSKTPSEHKFIKIGDQQDFEASKMTVQKSKQSLAYGGVSQSQSFGGYYEQYRDILESQKIYKNEREIEKENDLIRQYLKDMNVQLTKMVENTSVATFVPKKQTDFKHKSTEEKERVISKEIFNNDKILENLVEEHHKLKSRLDTIKDPVYLLNIDEQIDELKRKSEKIRKGNVKLNVATVFAGRDLNDLETEGIPPVVKEINSKGQELAIAKRKLDKLLSDNDNFDEEKKTKNGRLEELQEKFEKLTAIANHMKIVTPNVQKLEKHATLKKQVADFEIGIKFLENNNDKYIKNHLQKEVDELLIVYNRDKEHITLLEQMLDQQKDALKDMLEKETMKEKNDKATKELISKIKLTLDEVDNRYNFDSRIVEQPATTTNDDRSRKAGKPPIGKDPRKDIYEGLPLFSPTKVKAEAAKKIPTKRDFPTEREKTPEITHRIEEKPKKISEKKPPVDPKPFSRPSSHKDIAKEKPKEVAKEVKEPVEEKPKDEPTGAFSKPNIFKKPFARKVEDGEEGMKKEESAPLILNKPTNDINKLEPANNLGLKQEKKDGLSLPDFLQDTKKSPEIKKNELKLSDDLGPKKDNKSGLSLPNEGAGKLITDIPVDESINLGGVSRVRGGRQKGVEQPKKDDLWNSTDLKTDTKPEPKPEPKINDPFAKFDSPDAFDFGKKNLGLEKKVETKSKKNDDIDNMGLFNPVDEQPKQQPVVKKEAGLWGDDGDDLKKVQMRKGPRDRGGIGGIGGAQNKENIDDLFGGGGITDLGKEQTTTIDTRPARGRNMFDDKKKDDDLFGDDLFGKKTTLKEEPKKNEFSLKGDDFSSKKDDFKLNFDEPKTDFADPVEEKPSQKFSMAPENNIGGIGGKPRKINMGGGVKPEVREKDLAMKAEKGGGGFFDDFS